MTSLNAIIDIQTTDIPADILHIYEHKWFSAWSRQLNNALRFSSPGCTIPGGVCNTHFGGNIRVCGQVYTRIINADRAGPVRAWIQDTSLQLQLLEKSLTTCRATPQVQQAQAWLKIMSRFLSKVNPFANDLQQLGQNPSIIAAKYNLRPRDKHVQQENLNTQELAAVYATSYVNDKTDMFATIIAKERVAVGSHGARQSQTRLSQLKHDSPLWEPLAYPLLFPFGGFGWGHTYDGKSVFKDMDQKPITLAAYTRYMLLHHPTLAKLGRVRQAWVLEQYLRDEQSTLLYIQNHQEKMRKAKKSDAAYSVYTSNVLEQRAIAKNLLPPEKRDDYDILQPVPDVWQDEIGFDSIILEGHDYHHDDNGESFTASDLRYEVDVQE